MSIRGKHTAVLGLFSDRHKTSVRVRHRDVRVKFHQSHCPVSEGCLAFRKLNNLRTEKVTDFVNGGSVASQQEERLAKNGASRDERRDQLLDLVNRPLMMGLAAIQKCYEGPCVQEYLHPYCP